MNRASGRVHSKAELWFGAFTGFHRPGAEEVRRLDTVSKFLYASRSLILVISVQAALIGGLLAIAVREFEPLYFALVLIGFVIAHMISNLSNDYFGYKRGHDTPDSPRMRYTLHPLASGVLDRRTLATGFAVLCLAGGAVASFFTVERGWLALAFLVPGFVLLFWYDAAPVPLKAIGLGELATFVVWGPLMIGGAYAMITGHVSDTALYASIPYGLGVMSILVGKHIDQLEFDARQGNRTLPVLLGERAARRLDIAIVMLMYGVALALVALGRLSIFTLALAVAVPRAWRALAVLSRPRPVEPPAGYVGWPLWDHRVCLEHGRLFGWLYITGLAAGAIWPGARI